jgi:hypothetical protein
MATSNTFPVWLACTKKARKLSLSNAVRAALNGTGGIANKLVEGETMDALVNRLSEYGICLLLIESVYPDKTRNHLKKYAMNKNHLQYFPICHQIIVIGRNVDKSFHYYDVPKSKDPKDKVLYLSMDRFQKFHEGAYKTIRDIHKQQILAEKRVEDMPLYTALVIHDYGKEYPCDGIIRNLLPRRSKDHVTTGIFKSTWDLADCAHGAFDIVVLLDRTEAWVQANMYDINNLLSANGLNRLVFDKTGKVLTKATVKIKWNKRVHEVPASGIDKKAGGRDKKAVYSLPFLDMRRTRKEIFWTPSDEELLKLDLIAKNRKNDDVICTIGTGWIIKRLGMKRLLGKGKDKELDDEVIGAYASLLTSDHAALRSYESRLKIHAVVSSAFADLLLRGQAADGYFKEVFGVFPTSDIGCLYLIYNAGTIYKGPEVVQKGNHWTFYAVDLEHSELRYYDSIDTHGATDLRPKIRAWLRRRNIYLENNGMDTIDVDNFQDVDVTDMPQQEGVVECGVYALTAIRCLMQGLLVTSFNQATIADQRNRIALDLLAGKIKVVS